MDKKKLSNIITQLFWTFVIGCFIGYVIETAIVIFKGNYEIKKGLIYGPFIPVYGIGMVIYHLILSNLKICKYSKVKQIVIVFILTMVLGGTIEYLCSFIQEKCFGFISWDYSYLKFNLDGRTSLKHSLYWGILGIVYYIVGVPNIQKINKIASVKKFKIITTVCVILMTLDIGISALAVHRQYERRENVEANSFIDRILDSKYTDEYLSQIYKCTKEISNN